MNKWVLTIGGMTVTEGNWSTWRNTYPSATLSTTNATRTDLELHLDLHDMKLGTNYLNRGTGTMHTASNNLPC